MAEILRLADENSVRRELSIDAGWGWRWGWGWG
jgi:hypothetical protein